MIIKVKKYHLKSWKSLGIRISERFVNLLPYACLIRKKDGFQNKYMGCYSLNDKHLIFLSNNEIFINNFRINFNNLYSFKNEVELKNFVRLINRILFAIKNGDLKKIRVFSITNYSMVISGTIPIDSETGERKRHFLDNSVMTGKKFKKLRPKFNSTNDSIRGYGTAEDYNNWLHEGGEGNLNHHVIYVENIAIKNNIKKYQWLIFSSILLGFISGFVINYFLTN